MAIGVFMKFKHLIVTLLITVSLNILHFYKTESFVMFISSFPVLFPLTAVMKLILNRFQQVFTTGLFNYISFPNDFHGHTWLLFVLNQMSQF